MGLCGWRGWVRGEVGLSAFFRDLVGLKVRWAAHFCSLIVCLLSCAWKDSPPRSKSDGVIMELHDVTQRREPVIVWHPKKEATEGRAESFGLKRLPELRS